MKICLPTSYPPITSYPGVANILSILWVNKDKVLPWICDRYIQIIIRPYNIRTRSDFYDQADTDNYVCEGYLCPFIGWLRNNQTTANFSIFTDYIEYQIKHGYYLEPCLDNYYLSCSALFNKRHHIHSTFIYGFDNEKKLIYISDFYDNGRYTREKVSYDEINKSIEGIDYFINLFKYQESDYSFNITLLKIFIEDYINCRDSLKKFEFTCTDYNKDILYGLDFYNYIKDVFCNEYPIDTRPFHVLYDHKVMMKIRLEYLHKINVIDYNEFCILQERNNLLINSSHIFRNMAIKYNTTHDFGLLHRIKEYCNSLKQSDYNFFVDLLNCISK